MLPNILKQLLCTTALGMALVPGAFASDAPYPNKPIRVIVPSIAGGITDVASRLISKKMGEYLGQPFIIENRAGGDAIIGTRLVKDAPADGYTILGTHNGFSALPALKINPGYSPQDDFRGIGTMMTAPFLLTVSASQPYQTLPEFIAMAKKEGANLDFASPGIGTPNHIATEVFFNKTGIKGLTHVPFRGAAAAVIEVASGRIPFYVDAYTTTSPHVRSGKIRPLAVSSATRIPVMPDVPTLQELNIDYAYEYWLGFLAPRDTPDEVVARLSEALRHALSDQKLQAHFRAEGANLPYMTPAEFDRLIAQEVGDVDTLIKGLGIEKQ